MTPPLTCPCGRQIEPFYESVEKYIDYNSINAPSYEHRGYNFHCSCGNTYSYDRVLKNGATQKG